MIDVIKCIAGLVLFIYDLKELSVSSKEIKCDYKTDGNGDLLANCSNRGLTSIPQNLNTDITSLDISFNDIKTLHKSELKKYPLLRSFTMMFLPVTSFPHKFFKHTTQLIRLNITNTQIDNLKEIPHSIIFLNFTLCNREYIDLSHLVNLKNLTMRYSRLKKVPILDENVQMVTIDLKFSPLTEANYTHIARHCHLYYFGINSTELRAEKYIYQCCAFKYWVITRGIMSGYKGQGCNHSADDFSSCKNFETRFDKNAVNEFEVCRRESFARIIILIILGCFLFVLFGALVEVILHHLYAIGAFERLFPKNIESVEESSTMEVGSESEDF